MNVVALPCALDVSLTTLGDFNFELPVALKWRTPACFVRSVTGENMNPYLHSRSLIFMTR